MKTTSSIMLILILLLMSVPELKSFSPKGKNFGLGIMVGEPTGASAKYWTSNANAFAFSFGNSYLGKIRIGVDFLWHFNAFNSSVVSLYAGPGVAIGIGGSSGWFYNNKGRAWYRTDDNIGLGARGVFGMNFIPRNSDLEFFGELGVMVGFNPSTYTNVEGAIGFRYYF